MLNGVDRVAFQGLSSTPHEKLDARQVMLLEALAHIAGCDGCSGSGSPCPMGASLMGKVAPPPDPDAPTCCLLRRKIAVGVTAVLPEELCGVSNAELVDVIDWSAESESGVPVVAVRFCPWCGAKRKPGDDVRIR